MKIIDNCLNEEYFKFLQEQIMSPDFPWLYQSEVAWEQSNTDDHFYFIHRIYDENNARSTFCSSLNDLFEFLDVKALLRIRVLLYVNQGKMIIHEDHTDFSYSHKAALLYLNTNNGSTGFEDGTRVDSVENRLVLFDGSKPHNSSTCTDKKARLVLAVNYF